LANVQDRMYVSIIMKCNMQHRAAISVTAELLLLNISKTWWWWWWWQWWLVLYFVYCTGKCDNFATDVM